MFRRIGEIYRFKNLLLELIIRDIKVRYKNSLLGYLWTLLYPLILMGIYILVFSFVFRFRIENYPIFILCGIVPWILFQKTTSRSTTSIIGGAVIIKKVYFPRELVVLTVMGTELFNFALMLIVFIPIAIIYKVPLGPGMLFLPLALVCQVFFMAGVSLFLASSNVFFRDVSELYEALVRIWFYASPIIYPVSMVPERFQKFYMLNPMAVIISIYRNAVLGYEIPGYDYLALMAVLTLLMFIVGFWSFIKLEKMFLKLI